MSTNDMLKLPEQVNWILKALTRDGKTRALQGEDHDLLGRVHHLEGIVAGLERRIEELEQRTGVGRK